MGDFMNISIGQRWYRNGFEVGGGRNPIRRGESVVIHACPPERRWVIFRRESNGVLVGGYHPAVFGKFFSPNPQDIVLFEDGKFHLTVKGYEVVADTLAEAEALQIQARKA